MIKDTRVFLRHILESIFAIEEYIAKKTKRDFMKDRQMQDAIIRRFQVIGEATKNIPLHLREKYPAIRWRVITGMRDVLVHDYFDIDINMVWNTAKHDVAKFKKQIEQLLSEIEE